MASRLADERNCIEPPDGCVLWLTYVFVSPQVVASLTEVEKIVHMNLFFVSDYIVSFNQVALQTPVCHKVSQHTPPDTDKYRVTAMQDKKLSYRRETARCVVSIEILPIATQQCRNYLYDKS